jgi:hypothetical protein
MDQIVNLLAKGMATASAQSSDPAQATAPIPVKKQAISSLPVKQVKSRKQQEMQSSRLRAKLSDSIQTQSEYLASAVVKPLAAQVRQDLPRPIKAIKVSVMCSYGIVHTLTTIDHLCLALPSHHIFKCK